jgi:TIR domain
VDELQRALENAGIKVWRDRGGLRSGQQWQIEIGDAIEDHNCLAFLACFSGQLESRTRSYQHKELSSAAEQMKLRPPRSTWLIPVRFAECTLPSLDLGYGRTLYSQQRVDLFGPGKAVALESLIADLRERLGIRAPQPGGAAAAGYGAPTAGQARADDRRKGYPGRRVRGSMSLADARNWLLSAMLGVIAFVGAVVAFLNWPYSCVQDTFGACQYPPVPGRGACYFMIGLSLAVIVSSLAEGLRPRPAARLTRLIVSLACAVALAQATWVTNFASSWIIALAALGGLALLALVELADMPARLGGSGLLAGALMLIAGLLAPVVIGLGVPAFGLATGLMRYAWWLVALTALLLGAGWYYRWPNWALAVLVVIPASLAIYGMPGHKVVGPYVILVACALVLVSVALSAASPATPPAAPGRSMGPLVSSGRQ